MNVNRYVDVNGFVAGQKMSRAQLQTGTQPADGVPRQHRGRCIVYVGRNTENLPATPDTRGPRW